MHSRPGVVKGTDGRHPTLEDVGRRAGVSRALASLVIRGSPNVSSERRERVLAAAAELGYRPNAVARSLASRRSRTVGVLLHDLRNPYFPEIVEGIEAEAGELGYQVMLANAARSSTKEDRALEALLQHRVDGAILLSTSLSATRIEALAENLPVIVVSSFTHIRGADTILTDDSLGAHLAVEHLVQLGHRSIVHIDGGTGASSQPRRAGYRQAMRQFGLHPWVVAGEFTELAGVRAVDRLRTGDLMPTAIFAANDLIAVGAMDRLGDHGLRVPEDISVVGYDNIFLAALHHISLTTINQPRTDMGRLAMRILAQRLTEEGGDGSPPGTHLTAPTLVIRRTTAAAPAGPEGPR
jgi:DNA-binding LacI/PurR family transcriptional regulator